MADNIDTYRTVTPYLVVTDADAEVRFLEAAFGAGVTLCHRNDNGAVMHAELTIGNSQLMLGQASAQANARNAAFYLWVADCDAAYARALAAGAASESAPVNKDYGHRSGGVIDPNSITWWIASPIA
jgi:PhnB protein